MVDHLKNAEYVLGRSAETLTKDRNSTWQAERQMNAGIRHLQSAISAQDIACPQMIWLRFRKLRLP